jgi:hypothetical protein
LITRIFYRMLGVVCSSSRLLSGQGVLITSIFYVIVVCSSPWLLSPPVPRFTVSAPKEVEDPEYVIWCGTLRVKDMLDCEVKMVSTASQYKPAML